MLQEAVSRHALASLNLRQPESPLKLHLAGDRRTVFACHLELGDYLVHRTGAPFDREEYRAYPERFESAFHSKVRSPGERVRAGPV